MRTLIPLLLLASVSAALAQPTAPPSLKLLFLGDNAGHQPAARFAQLRPVFATRNIQLTYTDKLDDLNAENLSRFDGLLVYA
ncbi:hypothetical protein J0H58_32915, partial [bacterium]|nr:hypothetical protein [bacterium]